MIPTKADIKLIKSLDKKRARDLSGKFIIEGEKLLEEALSAGIEIVKVFRRDEIGEELMSRISLLSSPSPLLAIARKPSEKLFEIPKEEELYLALDSIKDPGNIGTIIRMAEWFGIKAIYCSLDCVDVYNPKVVQATMGSLFRVKVSYIELRELIVMAKKSMPVYGTFIDGENIYRQALPKGALVVMGSESHGISPELEKVISNRLNIPSFSKVANSIESLNVAVAASVVCSEFKRSFALKSRTV